MKKLAALLLCIGCVSAVSTSHAIDLKQSKLTQVVNEVEIISSSDQTKKSAVVNDVFTMPDILRTGPASRAELVADDQSVTRVGANTIFSFDPANRTIDLKQGSLLFHSPHGKGGGTIHTGSATASVLGSTLIVTTTANGGFKVLALEDEAEIKFLNGLKQTLEPGEMTFILPGGQLAPILIFRLDLTKDSLLVKGFGHPLDSMPLILKEIEKQLKLLKSGKVTDTGLVAGDNAGPNSVEVLDFNSIVTGFNKKASDVDKALATDATINESSLTAKSIPTPPQRIFFNPSFTLDGNNFYKGQSFRGFAGRNIFFNTTPAPPVESEVVPREAGSLAVDMSPYANKPEFDFVAAKDLDIEGSVTFTGLSAANKLALIAGDQLSISPNATVQADAGDFELSSAGALTLNNVSLINNLGDLHLTAGTDLTLNDDTLLHAAESGRIFMTGGNSVNLISSTPIGVDNATIVTDPDTGSVTMDSSEGSVTVTRTSIQTHFLTLNSGDGILLDAEGQTLTGGAGATANFTAPNLITVQNVDFSSFAILNMVGNTIDIINAILPPIANFGTFSGDANVNGTEIPGGLNIYNSSQRTSGGIVAITSTDQITFSSGPGNTPGIFSYSTGGGGEGFSSLLNHFRNN